MGISSLNGIGLELLTVESTQEILLNNGRHGDHLESDNDEKR